MPVIYHVTTGGDWEAARQKGFYEHPSLSAEGQTNLVKLVIDTDRLTSHFVFDWSPSTQDTFPHIYGPINLDAVTDVVSL